MIQNIKVIDLYIDYIEEVCFSQEAKNNNARINRNNSNASVPKKYLDVKKIRYAVSRKEYIDILTSINSQIAEEIISNNFYFNMPHRMGGLEVIKKKPSVKVDDEGKVINNLPIDWGATNKLWENDPIAKKKKKLIRHLNKHSNGYVFMTKYRKLNTNYPNKRVYNFRVSKTFRRLIPKLTKENPDIDFYLNK